jgi:predicted N-acyltransferase
LPLYAKNHSYGEYVFDWAWADAYERNGLDYYPKLLSAIPFTPVTGSRLIARDAEAQVALIAALNAIQQSNDFSSTHILYPPQEQAETLRDAGFMLRSGVQFHWLNAAIAVLTIFSKRWNARSARTSAPNAARCRKPAYAFVTLPAAMRMKRTGNSSSAATTIPMLRIIQHRI